MAFPGQASAGLALVCHPEPICCLFCAGNPVRCRFLMTGIPAFPGVDLAGNSIYCHFVTRAFYVNLNEREHGSASFDFRLNQPTSYGHCVLRSRPLRSLSWIASPSWVARQLPVCEALEGNAVVAFNSIMQAAGESLCPSSCLIALNCNL